MVEIMMWMGAALALVAGAVFLLRAYLRSKRHQPRERWRI